jgi:hypothetical protein
MIKLGRRLVQFGDFRQRSLKSFQLQLFPSLKLRFVQAWIVVGQIKLQTGFSSQNFKEFDLCFKDRKRLV